MPRSSCLQKVTRQFVIVLLLFTATAFGSDITATSKRSVDSAAREARAADMRERLGLTNEQSEQVKPILAESFEKTSVVLQNYGINLETGERPEKRLGFRKARKMKSELDVVRGDTSQALSAILSPEQMEVYEEIAEERRDEIRSRIRDSR